MRNTQRVALVGVAAMAAAVALTAPTAAVAAVAGTGAVLMAGSASTPAWVDDGTIDDGINGPVTIDGSASSVRVSVFEAPDATRATLATTVGTLPTSGTHAVSAAGPLTLTIDRPGILCTVTGDVTIRELVVDAGVPTAFAADWTGDCGTAVGTSGQVRGNSSVAWGGLHVGSVNDWLAPFVGEANDPTAFEVTGHGSAIPPITGVDIASAVPQDSFVIMHGTDHCTGVTLVHLGTCTVQVAAAPRSTTPATGTANLVVTTAGTTSASALSFDSPQVSKRGQYFPTNVRAMDTRTGLGVRKGVVRGGTAVSLPVAGKNGVPATGVSAAVFNVTVTGSTSNSFATVYPGGTARPGTSNLNFGPGFTGANLVTVPLGSNGAVSFYNGSGSTHFVADLVGYYAAGPTFAKSGGNDFFTTAPTRLIDTRTDWGVTLDPQEYFGLPLDFGADHNARIRGAVVTVTAVNATKAGFLALTSTEPTGPPTTSSLNYQPGATVANLVASQTSQVDWGGTVLPTIWVANSSTASTHVVIDIVGLYAQGVEGDEGLRFKPVPPIRILDTRSDRGAASVGTGVNTVVPAPLTVAGRDTWALAGNLTGVAPTASTFLTIWDSGARPGTSTVNLTRGVTRANAAWTGLSSANTYSVFNQAGSTDTLYDVTGTFDAWPASPETIAGVPWPPAPAAASARSARAPGIARGPAPTLLEQRRVLAPAPQHY